MTLKFSVAMQGSYPIRDYIDKAQRIEAYGFDEVHETLYDGRFTTAPAGTGWRQSRRRFAPRSSLTEICGNDTDDDCDELPDEADPDCAAP